MDNIEVTGIRYQMGEVSEDEVSNYNVSEEDELTDKEIKKRILTERARVFIRGIKNGTLLTLQADPTNPADKKAIEVYLDDRRVGYINKNQCDTILPLLDENGYCEARKTGDDGHVTMLIEIEGAPEQDVPTVRCERVLPAFPLHESIRLDYSLEEKRLRAFAPQIARIRLDEQSPTLLDNARAFIEKVEKFLSLASLSFCKEDSMWREHVLKMLRKACTLPLPDTEKDQLKDLSDKLQDIVGDFHYLQDNKMLDIFERQLSMLRNQAEKELAEGKDGLFSRFEQSFSGMPVDVDCLVEWFKAMSSTKLYDYHNHAQMVMTLNYLRISRAELYEIYAALLLIKKYGNEPEENEPQTVIPKERNYFAPAMMIKDFLKQNWFVECRTDKKYNAQWRSDFMDALMDSEWKDQIADNWAVDNKRLTIKCQIIGVLADEGVLKGNYSELARATKLQEVKPATLAKYMGMGKEQPFADWIKEYIIKNKV